MNFPGCLRVTFSSTFAMLLLGAVVARGAQAQEAAAKPEVTTITATPARTQKVSDLTSRYRFSELYTRDDDHTGPGVVGSYRVAIMEVAKDSVDNPQGAPKRTDWSRQSIFTESPLESSGRGGIASVSRTYERFRARPENPSRTMGGRPLDGLSLIVRPKLGELPQLISLIDGRLLTEYEFDTVARQIFVPHLATLLPSQAIRIGDTWRIARKGAQALLGDPSVQGDTLVGKLGEIRKEVDGPRLVAAIAVTGRVVSSTGDTTVNAEILFTFVAESSLKDFSTKPAFPPRPTEDITESRGAITEVRLAKVTSGPVAGPGRLRFQSNREVTLHRQIGLAAGALTTPRPAQIPEASEANAWILHVDTSGRYTFRHPQDFLIPDTTQAAPEPNTSLLGRTRREGRDLLQVEFFPKVLTPEDLKKALTEKYGVWKMEVIKGEETWLPEPEWPKMKVHRIDADLKVGEAKGSTAPGGTRLHFDGYLILFGQSSSMIAIASTSRGSVGPYRREVEQILKSIQLDPARPAVD